MSSEVQVQFRRIVEQIFSNWTGLKMAVEHSMAGPHSRQIAHQTIDHMCNYCFTANDVQVEDLCDELEDILDEEFNTICEDNSPNDVAHAMWKFLQIIKLGNMEQFHAECNNLPPLQNWLTQPVQPARVEKTLEDSSSDEETTQGASMDVDPEWTVVKSKKKK